MLDVDVFQQSLQAKIDVVGNCVIVGRDRFITMRLLLHCSESTCNSHLKLPAPTSSEFKGFTNPYLSAQDILEGKPQLRDPEGGWCKSYFCML